jgi:hypothetical protein
MPELGSQAPMTWLPAASKDGDAGTNPGIMGWRVPAAIAAVVPDPP